MLFAFFTLIFSKRMECEKFIDMVLDIILQLIGKCPWLSSDVVLKKNIHKYLENLLKYFFSYLTVWGQIIFTYFNQSDLLQYIECSSRYETSAAPVKLDTKVIFRN